jgi:hypothetical protein
LKVGIEIYISLIILTIAALLCANFIAADVGVMNARDLQAAYVSEIENSDLSPTVIAKCENNAKSLGYDLDVNIVNIGDSNMAQVSLTYTYKVPLIGVESEHVITGYAR